MKAKIEAELEKREYEMQTDISKFQLMYLKKDIQTAIKKCVKDAEDEISLKVNNWAFNDKKPMVNMSWHDVEYGIKEIYRKHFGRGE